MLEKPILIALDRRTPLLFSALYLLCAACMNRRLSKIKGPFQQRELLSRATFFMVFYNVSMCFISLSLFKKLFSALESFYANFGFMHLLQDPSSVLRRQTEFYIRIFYATKYLEALDILAMRINRKKATFLHVYNHIATIICSWLLCISGSHLSCIFIYFNTLVRMLMYGYYALLSLRISLFSSFKKIVAWIQIAQLVLGSSIFLSITASTEALSRDPEIRRLQNCTAALLLLYAFSFLLLLRPLVKSPSGRAKLE